MFHSLLTLYMYIHVRHAYKISGTCTYMYIHAYNICTQCTCTFIALYMCHILHLSSLSLSLSLFLSHIHTRTQHSIIDEPIDYGVGIVASTDNWSVKIMSATKNLHTRSVTCKFYLHLHVHVHVTSRLSLMYTVLGRSKHDSRLQPVYIIWALLIY